MALACAEKGYLNAGNGLDAAREFIGACLQGDFARAAFYTLPDENNQQKLKEIESSYRQKDKEGRQQYRQASINIHEVNDSITDTVIVRYGLSVDKTPLMIKAVRTGDHWLVDISNSNLLIR